MRWEFLLVIWVWARLVFWLVCVLHVFFFFIELFIRRFIAGIMCSFLFLFFGRVVFLDLIVDGFWVIISRVINRMAGPEIVVWVWSCVRHGRPYESNGCRFGVWRSKQRSRF